MLEVQNLQSQKTVFLVDDLDMLRQFVRDFLESVGMKALEASNAVEAIHTIRSHPGKIDLLLTDIEMPETSGPGVGEPNRRSKAWHWHCLCVLGGGLREWNEYKEKPVGAYFIQKPVHLKRIESALGDDPLEMRNGAST